MKLFVFLIFYIIELKLILSKNLKPSDIFKGGNSGKNFNSKNKTKSINSTNDCNHKDQEDYEESKEGKSDDSGDGGEPLNDISGGIKKIEELHKILTLEKQILFMASCLKGGLTSDNHILDAYEWALQNNYYGNDKYDDLAKKISKKFKANYHNDWRISIFKKQHSCAIVSGRKIIFDYNGLRNRAKKIFSIKDIN